MSYIFIEFDINNGTIKGYYIGTCEDELYNYIIQELPLLEYYFHNIKIATCKKINLSDLTLYQQILGFVGQDFCSIKRYDILKDLEEKYLKREIHKLVSHIFDIYRKIDPDFESCFRQKYLNHISNLKPLRDFLTQCYNYLEYRELLNAFNPGDRWDSNIN